MRQEGPGKTQLKILVEFGNVILAFAMGQGRLEEEDIGECLKHRDGDGGE